jgi:hypothetical protein
LGREGRDPFSREVLLAKSGAVLARIELHELDGVAVDASGEQFGELLGADDFAAGVLAFHLADAGDVEGVVMKVDRGDGNDAAAAPEDGAVVPALFLSDFEPAGAAAGDGEGPAAEESVLGGGDRCGQCEQRQQGESAGDIRWRVGAFHNGRCGDRLGSVE